MAFNEDNDNDYFEEEYVPEEPKKPKEPKKPALKPEDPRYWDEPEPEFEHLRPERPTRIWLWVALCGVIVGLLYAGWLYVVSPAATNAVTYGYIEQIEDRGALFKTYEGILLPYKNLMDTTRVYEGDFVFSTVNDTTAVFLRKMQGSNLPVRVEYRRYRTAMPWRGETRCLVIKADSVNPSLILPPDRQPALN